MSSLGPNKVHSRWSAFDHSHAQCRNLPLPSARIDIFQMSTADHQRNQAQYSSVLTTKEIEPQIQEIGFLCNCAKKTATMQYIFRKLTQQPSPRLPQEGETPAQTLANAEQSTAEHQEQVAATLNSEPSQMVDETHDTPTGATNGKGADTASSLHELAYEVFYSTSLLHRPVCVLHVGTEVEEAKRLWCLKKLAERNDRQKKRMKRRATGRAGGVTKRHRSETDYLVSNMVSAPNFHKELEAGNIFGLDTDPSDKGVQVPVSSGAEGEGSAGITDQIKLWRERKVRELLLKKKKKEQARKRRQDEAMLRAKLVLENNKMDGQLGKKESYVLPQYRSSAPDTGGQETSLQ